jgi:type I restriction enzyme S subunit
MSEWIETTVADVVARCYSGPSPTCDERNIRSEEEWGLLKTTAVTWAGWNEFAHKVPPLAYWHNKAIEVHPGDVVITKAGPRHRVGVVVDVPSTQPRLMVSGKMIGLTPITTTVLPRILAGVLATRGPQKYLDQRTTGMAESQVNFTNEALLGTPIRIPVIHEQRSIADILDAVDDAIRSTEIVIAKLKQVKRGMLHDFMGRGIDEDGNIRDPALHPDLFVDSPIGSTPASWRILSCQEATSAPIGYGIVQAGPYVPGGVFVLMIRDLDGDFRTGLHRTSPSIDAAYGRSRVRPGDVLLSVKATIGRVAVVPDWYEGNISRDMARLRPGPECRPGFLRLLLCSELGERILQQTIVGTTRAEVSIGVLRKVLIPVPPLDEQDRIVGACEAIDSEINTAATDLSKLRLIKAGLMDDLLTGRVRVHVDMDAG